MENLKLIKPNKDFEVKILDMVNEFKEYDSKFYGSSGLENFLNNYDGRLENLQNNENKDTVAEGRVPAFQYILIRESDNKVIGFVNVRLELNEGLLQHGGHIGYSIRPSERMKNYATAQLFAILEFYKNLGIEKVLLTCDKDNIGSAKTIQKCGGILENEIIDPEDGVLIQRYWIDVNKGIEIGTKFFEDYGFDIEIL